MAYLEQSTRYVPYTDRPRRALEVSRARRARRLPAARGVHRARSTPPSRPTRAGSPRWKRTSARSTRSRRRIPTRVYKSVDPRQGARHAARPAAGRDDVERRPVRDGPGVRSAAAADVRAPARGGPRLRAADAGRAAPGHPGVPRPASISRTAAAAGSSTSPRRDAASRRSRSRSSPTIDAEPRDEVTLTDFDPDGEIESRRRGALRRVGAARRSAARHRAADVAPTIGRRCSAPTSATRANRRHKPGRAFERTSYRFDVLADYGAFRDLQRHRLLTLEWQPLSAAPRLRRAGRDRRSRRARGLARGHGAVGRPARTADRRTGCATPRRTPS